PGAGLQYKFGQGRFGGTTNAIGQRLSLDKVSFTIVGVTGPDFFGPDVGRAFDVAIPIGTEPLFGGKEAALAQRSCWWLSVMARLKSGQTIDAGTAAIRAYQPQLREATLPA